MTGKYNKNIVEIFDKVAKHFDYDPEKTFTWFDTPHPFLGGVSPREMIGSGREDRLLEFIEDAERANQFTPGKP